ncbi:hypothetical protein OSTOST_11263 [Ostertagia ostertagi]
MSLVYFNEILKVIEKSVPLKRTIAGVATQAGCAAAGTAAGGLTLGPLGALIGGIMGAVYGYNCSGDYDSLLFALRAMSEREKRQVTEQVQRLVGSASVEELLRYITTEAHRKKFFSSQSAYFIYPRSRSFFLI